METKIITELVQFQNLNTTTDEQIVVAVDKLNEFQESLDGFLDAELVKEVKENLWCIIFHYENFEKVQAIGTEIRNSREFAVFNSLIEPRSLKISFHRQLKIW